MGRQLLIVLDDVVDDGQVRFLLPGSPTCAVLMTSRSQLAGVEGVQRHSLTPMTASDSQALLARLVGSARIAPAQEALDELVALCAGLPLALRIVAARLISRPDWPVEHLVRLLADERRRLDWLKVEDIEVRASLMLSYRSLSHDEQHLFRLLGLLKAPDFPGWVAAALTGDPLDEADRQLGRLLDMHLVDVVRRGDEPRYSLHPLVRLLAEELSDEEAVDVRADAIARVVGGYLTVVARASESLPRWLVLDPLPGGIWTPPGVGAEHVQRDPRTWFAAEHGAIAATIQQAAQQDLIDHSWRLLQCFAGYLDLCHDLATLEALVDYLLPQVKAFVDLRGEAALLRLRCHPMGLRDQFSELPAVARRAVDIREHLGDAFGEVEARRTLGSAILLLGRPDEARQELEKALALARQVDDCLGLSSTLCRLAEIHYETDMATALQLLEEALVGVRAAGGYEGRIAQTAACLLAMSNRVEEAEGVLAEARGEAELWGDAWRIAAIDTDLAHVYVDLGRLDEAQELVERADRIMVAHDDMYGEGVALSLRSRLALANGRIDEAIGYARRSQEAWQRLPNPPVGITSRWRGPNGLPQEVLAPVPGDQPAEGS